MQRFVWLLMILALAVPAASQSNWGGRTTAGEWAFARGDFDRAESEFRAALKIAQRFPDGDVRLEESLRNLGRLYEHQSRFDEAEPMYELLLAAQEYRAGSDAPVLLDTLAALARVAVPTGNHPVALESLERFVDIADGAGLTDDDRLRVVLASLARIYLIEEKGNQALAAQRRATDLTVANEGLEADECAASLESLAQLEIRFGDGEKALAAVERAAAVRRRERPNAPVDDTFLGAIRTALAEHQSDLASRLYEAFQAAEPEGGLTRDAAELQADVAWAAVRREGGSLIDLMGVTDDPDALETAAEALAALDQILEADGAGAGARRTEVLDRAARVAVMRGDLNQATTLQQTLIPLVAASAGPSAEPTRIAIRGLIDLLLEQTRNDEAIEANARLIGAIEQAFGPRDPRLLAPLQLQFDLLKDARRRKEAKAIKKRIKKID